MIKAGSISKGMYILWKNEPFFVVDKEFFNPGKGAAVVRLKIKGLTSGNLLREVLKTDDQVEEIVVDHFSAQYLYKTSDQFVFMNPRSFDQYQVDGDIIGEDKQYLKEGAEYRLESYQDKIIGICLPKKMVFEVTEAEDEAKGDTVTGATKPVKIETGLVVKVPLFIRKGEKIFVNTQTGEYVSRKN